MVWPYGVNVRRSKSINSEKIGLVRCSPSLSLYLSLSLSLPLFLLPFLPLPQTACPQLLAFLNFNTNYHRQLPETPAPTPSPVSRRGRAEEELPG